MRNVTRRTGLVALVACINLAALVLVFGPPSIQANGPVATDNGDVNGDGGINIGDPIYLLEYLFAQGPAPVAIAGGPDIPSGIIVLWSGMSADVPIGWDLCDGSDGTPDLRDRFVVGAGGTYIPGETGGLDEVTLTTAQMPAHSHSYNDYYWHDSGNVASYSTPTGDDVGQRLQTVRTTSFAGGSDPIENRPPYYALAYIMKE